MARSAAVGSGHSLIAKRVSDVPGAAVRPRQGNATTLGSHGGLRGFSTHLGSRVAPHIPGALGIARPRLPGSRFAPRIPAGQVTCHRRRGPAHCRGSDSALFFVAICHKCPPQIWPVQGRRQRPANSDVVAFRSGSQYPFRSILDVTFDRDQTVGLWLGGGAQLPAAVLMSGQFFVLMVISVWPPTR